MKNEITAHLQSIDSRNLLKTLSLVALLELRDSQRDIRRIALINAEIGRRK